VIDFRYHALSLVAVFLALGIGIVLGASVGDSLVSGADKDVRQSLRNDVVQARQEARDAQAKAAARNRVIQAAAPFVSDDRLAGQRVAVVALGGLPNDVESEVRKAVEGAGGSIDSTSDPKLPDDLGEIATAAGSSPSDPADPDGARRLGTKVGRAIVAGGRVARRLERALPSAFHGDYAGADGAVVYRAKPEDTSGKDAAAKRQADAVGRFEVGVTEGLRSAHVPAVGVEQTDTDPSQISWYRDRDLSTVDDVDEAGGQAALVLVLAGESGHYGVKKSADAPLPKPPG
jgi:hypothetical protein